MFVLLVLLMFAVPYVVSSFRERRKSLSTLSDDREELVNQSRMSIVGTNEPAAAATSVLYRSA